MVAWAGEGTWPPIIHSATLEDAANAAAAAVATLHSRYPPVPDAELQMAIFPSKYRGELILDIGEDAGTFTARNLQGAEPTVTAPSLDQLIEAARHLSDVSDGQYMFRWIRPVASLPPPDPPPNAKRAHSRARASSLVIFRICRDHRAIPDTVYAPKRDLFYHGYNGYAFKTSDYTCISSSSLEELGCCFPREGERRVLPSPLPVQP